MCIGCRVALIESSLCVAGSAAAAPLLLAVTLSKLEAFVSIRDEIREERTEHNKRHEESYYREFTCTISFMADAGRDRSGFDWSRDFCPSAAS